MLYYLNSTAFNYQNCIIQALSCVHKQTKTFFMQKTITLKNFKVFLLKTVLSMLVLGISFQVSLAQDGALTKPSSARKGQPTTQPVATKKVDLPASSVNKQGISKKQLFAAASIAEPTDVPAINKIYADKFLNNPGLKESIQTNSLTPNGLLDVCTFTGALASGDATLTAGRPFRGGVASTCAAPGACGAPFGTGPYFYDTYTMQNFTGVSQCITVNYIANVGGGDIFVSAFLGSFNPASICTNRIADGGSSSLSGGAAVNFSFNLAANATVVFVVNGAQISTACPSYTMTVTGITCAAPPPCTPPNSSVLSQVQIPTGTLNLINESFSAAALPAGWIQQNLSSPIGTGLFSDWFQGTTGGAFAANSAPDFRGASFLCGSGTSTLSNWLFAPNITLKNGDVFKFHTRSISGAFPDRMQLRLSTNGASTNVGSSATSVGDFTTMLVDINPSYTATGYPTAWTQFSVTLSGLPAAGISGRLAFRYFVENGGPGGANSNTIGVDDVLYSTQTFGLPTTCTGSTASLKIDINGGTSPTYNVVIGASPATAGYPRTILGYTSGANIPVTPAVTTTYNLISVVGADNATCTGTGNSGTPTVTVSPITVAGITVTAAPSTPLCAGNPTMLTIIGAPSAGTSTTSSGPITVAIPDNNPAGTSTPLTVAGIPATAVGTSASVTFNITHTWDGDVVLFLKSPNNQVLNLVNQRGGTGDNFVNTVISSTAVTPISAGTAPFTGTFLPDGNNAAPPPTGFIPTATTFTPLINTAGQLNGTWALGARDIATGDVGTITSWGVTINYNVPAGPPVGYTFAWTPAAGLSSTTNNPVAASPMTTTTYTVMGTAPNGCQTTGNITINVNQLPAVTTQPVNVTACATSNATFNIVGSGAGITYQWQVSTNGGVLYTNIPAGAPYGGITTNTLTITNVPASFNNNRYRCVVSGTCPPSANSAGAILTVNDLPVIVITPGTPVCGGVAGTNGTLLKAGSAAPPIPGSVTVNSGTIAVPVPDNNVAGATHNITVAGVPANATISGMSVKFNMTHTWNGDMVIALKAPNNSILNLDYYLSSTGGTGATTGFVNTIISSAGTAALSSGSGTYTGTFKADAVVTGVGGSGGPTGFLPNVSDFPGLFTTPNNGTYTLAMYDGGGGDLGTLTSWGIKIDYTTPGGAGNPLTYTWSPATGLYSNAIATVPYIAGTQTDQVYAAPTNNTVYTVTGTNGLTGCVNSGTVGVTYTPKAPIVNPAAPSMCLGDVAIPLSITSSLAPSPFTTTYSSGAISIPVLDNTLAGSTSTINVPLPATAQITNMTVAVNISHTWAGDMAVALKAPNNSILNLDYFISGTGGTGATAGLTNTRFSSTATAAISTGANPYNGVFKPDATVGNGAFGPSGPTGFNATVNNFPALYSTPNGNWTLGVYDGFAGDAGTLTSWSLTFDYLFGPPAPGIWSPTTGLWLDAAASLPYAGTSVNTVYARPGTSTNYAVTVASIGPDSTKVFSNPAAITINDGGTASPYPSNIAVSGLPTSGAKVQSVSITGLSHTWSDDIDVLLQSPTGTNVTLMSDVGGTAILTNVNYTFNDAAAANMNPTAGNLSGSYKPTNNGATDNYPGVGPGAVTDATPALANFTGNANGSWKLFIVDDVLGDQGNITGGYSITFTYPTTGCTSAVTQVPVTVNIPVIINPATPVNAVVCTDKVTSFSVTLTQGTTPTYQWQVSTDVGNVWTNVSNGGVYAGATSATLTITAPPLTMSGYLYRCIVTGKAPCGPVTSAQRLLTVNPLPTIVIAASPFKKLFPGLRTTMFSTVTPAASSGGYVWLRNGVQVPGSANSSSLLVSVDGLGDYTLRVTDVNGCTNTSNLVTITDSVSGRVFIYPNPNSGQFQVRYHSIINNTGLPRGINVYDARGKRVATQTYSISAPYARMDVDLRNHSTGVYWIEVVDVNGNRLAMGRADVMR